MVGGLAAIIVIAFSLSVAAPVTREHCLDAAASESTRQILVHSKWTPIVWPPPPVVSADPRGLCVRNSLIREGLHQIGIWKLQTPEEQVRDHLRDQVQEP